MSKCHAIIYSKIKRLLLSAQVLSLTCYENAKIHLKTMLSFWLTAQNNGLLKHIIAIKLNVNSNLF